MGTITTLEEGYAKAHAALLRKYWRRAPSLVFLLYGAFVLVDWLTYPQHFVPFLLIRGVTCSLILVGLLALNKLPDEAILLMGVIIAILASFSVVLMGYIAGGAMSQHHTGLVLVLVFCATAIPWGYVESLILSGTTIIVYILACYVYYLQHECPPDYWAPLSNNLGFLLAISTLCIYGNAAQTRHRKERFRLNFALGNQNDELTHTIDALGQAQTQLIHSEKLNALGSLSAGLLHEINNPLNFSMTALHMIKLEEVYSTDSEFAETVDDIGEGMARIQTIVGDLKAFAYPSDADKQTAFSIKTAIESALRFTSTERDGIALKQDLACADSVIGSHSHIVQILINLITNATRAIRAQGTDHHGLLHISTHCEDDTMWVAVRDNGIGMDQETQSRIFEPFFTTRVVGEGVGMGLSICHTIMENHDGALEVESKLGEGAVFTFTLKTQTD